MKKETKSKRICFALRPSLFDLIKNEAKLNGLSVNETIAQIIGVMLKKEK